MLKKLSLPPNFWKMLLIAGILFIAVVFIGREVVVKVWQSDVRNEFGVSKVTYVDTGGKLADAKQIWYIFINPRELKVRAYPMKKVGKRTFECLIPQSKIKHGYVGWIYPSKEYLGKRPIIFDFTPYINFALSQQKI